VLRSARRAGLTLIELNACCVLLAGGLAVAVAAARRYGWLGGLIGFFVGLLVWAGVLALLITAGEALWLAGARLPRCHSGLCRTTAHYDVVNAEGTWVLRCRCGRDYVREGRRFLERLPDGTIQPYMVHRPFRGWFRDTGTDG
jgi:hypothetical protein